MIIGAMEFMVDNGRLNITFNRTLIVVVYPSV